MATFDEMIEEANQIKAIQGQDGNWNSDPYMFGVYNGIEVILAIFESREPTFRERPDEWKGTLMGVYKEMRDLRERLAKNGQ